VNEPLAQIVFIARFLCFMAIFYLALHKLAARLTSKPDGKLMWFFSVLTRPLTRPVRAWISPGASEEQLLSRSLVFYACMWLCFVALEKMAGLSRWR
jgi:hypothetical protein